MGGARFPTGCGHGAVAAPWFLLSAGVRCFPCPRAARGEHCPAPWGLLRQVGLDRLMFLAGLFYTPSVSSVSSPLASAPGPPFALPSAVPARRRGEEQAWPNHRVGACCLGCERSCSLPAMGAALRFSPQRGWGKKLPQVSGSKAKSRGCFKP